MSDKAAEPHVHRLLDMVVEEVSLVDRPANQRRFLVVKRDEMENGTQVEKAPAPSDDDPTADPPADVHAMDGSALDVATAALESLTAMVELLGSGETADPRLSELGQELRSLCEELLGALGDGSDSDEARAAEEPEGEAAEKSKQGAPPEKDDQAATSAASAERPARMKRALTRLGELVAKLGEAKKAAPPEPPPASQVKKEDAAPNPDMAALQSTVGKLAESVQALTTSIQESQQRLSRVEKQFGLPNSAGPTENKPKVPAHDVGWPLDLNRPMDRESVDKAVSFHDP